MDSIRPGAKLASGSARAAMAASESLLSWIGPLVLDRFGRPAGRGVVGIGRWVVLIPEQAAHPFRDNDAPY
jgi:hypothetical protein